MLTVVPDVAGALPADGQPSSLIDQIVRDGARQMLAAALQAEVAAYVGQFAGLRDENGRRMVVRNGTAGPRTVLTSAGAVELTAPRVNDKRTDPATGERKRFSSAILPPWARKTPQVSEVLPLLYLHGLSSGDFVPALGQFLGSHAGLSASTVTRLTETWSAEAAAFMTRDLSVADYVCLWVDGIHLGIRLGEGKLCLLVMIGVRADGRKELVALADGYRESAESWADLLRDCARRGMRAPVLAIGDGALGFWTAVHEVFPQARTQRCWFHKIANVLGALPKSAHPGAKKALAEIWNAEDKDHARKAVKAFAAAYGRSSPRPPPRSPRMRRNCWRSMTTRPSTGCICGPRIESTFATVRHRTKVTKGPGSRAAGPAMAFKLIEAAQDRWRAVNAPHLVALVRAGATFVNGKLVERPDDTASPEAA
jgi:transposase-like protein